MTEKEWRVEIQSVMSFDKRRKYNEAISKLKSLVKRLRRTESAEFTYVQEALSFIAMIYERKGDLKRAAEYWVKAAEEHQGLLKFHTHAAAFRFATAALCQFKAGNERKGIALGKEALRLAKLDVDPSAIYQELLTYLRDSYQKKAIKKSKRNSGG